MAAACASSASCRVSASAAPGLDQQVEIADDDEQQVVEVVRQSAGQLADGFHLLRLQQLLFALPKRRAGDLLPGLAQPAVFLRGAQRLHHLVGFAQAGRGRPQQHVGIGAGGEAAQRRGSGR